MNIPAITNKHDLEDYLESTGPLWVTDDRNVYWNLSQCIRIDLMPEHFKKSPRPIS